MYPLIERTGLPIGILNECLQVLKIVTHVYKSIHPVTNCTHEYLKERNLDFGLCNVLTYHTNYSISGNCIDILKSVLDNSELTAKPFWWNYSRCMAIRNKEEVYKECIAPRMQLLETTVEQLENYIIYKSNNKTNK